LIREATINAIKHANAQRICIQCHETDTHVVVSVSDDGVGFDQSVEKLNHYGLSIMQERASRLNGKLLVNSRSNQGCEVLLEYPKIKEANIDRM
jgi:two-component system nitrate/nitrite sensor histidine kinase NarQ